MLCGSIALEKHFQVATRAERIQSSKHWILTLNIERPQHPLNQRPDFAQAKRECRRLHDEHLARTQQDYRTTTKTSKKDNHLRAWKNTTTRYSFVIAIKLTESVNRTPSQTACKDTHSVSQHILNRLTTFQHGNTRGSRAGRHRIAHLCVPKKKKGHPRVMSFH